MKSRILFDFLFIFFLIQHPLYANEYFDKKTEQVILKHDIICTLILCSHGCGCNSCGEGWHIKAAMKGTTLPSDIDLKHHFYREIIDNEKPLPQCHIHNDCEISKCSIKDVEAAVTIGTKYSSYTKGNYYVFYVKDWHYIN